MKRHPFPLYHWSPSDRREKINKRGMRLKCSPVTHSQKFQYLCWSDSPSLAWALSGTHCKTEMDFDLYMVWSDKLGKLTRRKDLMKAPWWPTEYRSFRNVPKKDIWLVGTRRHKPGRRKK